MTDTVVVNKDSTVVVDTQQPNNIVAQEVTMRTIVTGIMGPPGAATFSQLRDIDLAQLGSGSLLVYNDQTHKWTATTLLDQQIVESGQF